MFLKCIQCNLIEDESTIYFYKRTRKDYYAPFFCKFCLRIKHLNENPDLAKKKQEKHEEKINRKRDLKNFIKKTQELEFIQLGIKENIELLRKKNFEYRQTETGKLAIKNAYVKRRDQILEAIENLDEEELSKVKEFYKNIPVGQEVDHIIPISKGGKHCLSNLQYLTPFENKQKSNKIDKFLIEKLCDGQKVSFLVLMRKFKMTKETAKQIIEEVWY